MQDVMDNVVLLDENGEQTEYEHILTFLYEGERYVALAPVDQPEDGEEAEVVLLKVQQKNGEDTYVTIDNPVMLDEVFSAFLEFMDEAEEDGEK